MGEKEIQECDSDTIKDVIKIRLYMWQVNCNYKRDNTDTKCYNKEEWEELTEIYRKKKKQRTWSD